jgi:hypothetical protein
MMAVYTQNAKMLWELWDPEFQRGKAQSEVVNYDKRNAHMSCQHESNEINMFVLPEDEEYVKEADTGDKPLQDSPLTQIGSQPTQIGKRFKSQMHKAPVEEGENAHSWCLR